MYIYRSPCNPSLIVCLHGLRICIRTETNICSVWNFLRPSPQFLAYLAILCFERRNPKQNTAARLKSQFLVPTKFWACYVTGEVLQTKRFFRNFFKICNVSVAFTNVSVKGLVRQAKCRCLERNLFRQFNILVADQIVFIGKKLKN